MSVNIPDNFNDDINIQISNDGKSFGIEYNDFDTCQGLISPEIFLTDSTIEYLLNGGIISQYTITTATSGNPTIAYITGGGTYDSGDTVTLTVNLQSACSDTRIIGNSELMVSEVKSFTGWYINGTLISSDLTYSFTATEDITIVAEFISTVDEEDLEDIHIV